MHGWRGVPELAARFSLGAFGNAQQQPGTDEVNGRGVSLRLLSDL